ncbi:MAG: metal-dependent transcriptional regulator [Planctomycetes bacterium]|nr:metal-dependent transcriptional regulator [Planctomycetota bacterium]
MTTRDADEALERIWTYGEECEHRLSVIKKKAHATITPSVLNQLEEENLIAYSGDDVLLTRDGKRYAAGIIRRHRLAERMLVDILNMDIDVIEPRACEFEHVIIDEVVDSICTLLGHPKECPHGLPIPEGKCCHETRNTVKNSIMPLDKLDIGEKAKIAYISTNRNHGRLSKLISFGVTPGRRVQVNQKFPSFVIKCDQSELSMEKEFAKEIFVWRENYE